MRCQNRLKRFSMPMSNREHVAAADVDVLPALLQEVVVPLPFRYTTDSQNTVTACLYIEYYLDQVRSLQVRSRLTKR